MTDLPEMPLDGPFEPVRYRLCRVCHFPIERGTTAERFGVHVECVRESARSARVPRPGYGFNGRDND